MDKNPLPYKTYEATKFVGLYVCPNLKRRISSDNLTLDPDRNNNNYLLLWYSHTWETIPGNSRIIIFSLFNSLCLGSHLTRGPICKTTDLWDLQSESKYLREDQSASCNTCEAQVTPRAAIHQVYQVITPSPTRDPN